jgi:acyl-CoA synthetase (AMP-forming)/AMP-acid ligase II
VGRPVPPNEVRIIAITDNAIADWHEARELEVGEVGEITVAGPTATDTYFNRDAQTRQAKIRERLHKESSTVDATPGSLAAGATAVGDRVVHRMGDVGYFDAEGRLWFCGRKSHRVETVDGPLYTEQVEPVFNVHPDVRRTALVGVGALGAQHPVLCVELADGVPAREWPRIERELRQLGARHAHTARITRFLRHQRFPVDIRHNAKIGREKLALWAAQQGVTE